MVASAGCDTNRRVSKSPDFAEDLVMAGDAAIMRGDREAALRQFALAIEVNPRLTRAHMGMGDLYRLDGDFEKAEKSYNNAASVEPANFDAQYFHGLMLHLLNRFSEAISAYLRALRLRPDNFEANLNLATAYYQLNEPSQALPFAESAVKINPRSGAARLNLGVVYAGLDRHRDAVAEYQQAAELMDLTPQLLLNLADSLGRLQRYEEMRNTLDQLIKSQPSAAAFERQGFALFRLTQYADARAAFEQSLQLDPNYFPALNGLGVSELNTFLWSDRKDNAAKERALAALRRSLAISRNQPRIEELLTRYK